MMVVVAYDICEDQRREDVATLLSGYGPRVQLSVFECQVDSPAVLDQLRERLRDLIDVLTDQVRIYPITSTSFAGRSIIGARMVEERADFWIVR